VIRHGWLARGGWLNSKAEKLNNFEPMIATKRLNYEVVLSGFLGTAITVCIISFLWSRPAMGQGTNRPPAQRLFPPPSQNPFDLMSVEEKAHYAITEPQAYCVELAKYKTAEQLQTEQHAAFAITWPAAFCAEFDRSKTPERRQLEASGAVAILNPEVYNAEAAKQKTAAQIEEEAAAAIAIQHPHLPQVLE
jgi:NACalpha-BTF3-like transcription factor